MEKFPTPIVKIENVSFNRGSRVIFDNININIPKGKITAIMGPSGTGKTTLLRLIGAQLRPHQGNVTFKDVDIHALRRKPLYEMRKQMAMLFQAGGLFTNLSVYDNVAFAVREHTRLPECLIRDIVLMKLQIVGLRGARDLMPNELSGGMARRVALARAIALDPDMIMYDEPFAGQDPIGMGMLVKLIHELNEALGMTSIIVSHDINETFSIADYVYIVSEGKVISHGTPEELQSADQSAAKQFIRGLPDGPVPFHFPAKDYSKDILC